MGSLFSGRERCASKHVLRVRRYLLVRLRIENERPTGALVQGRAKSAAICVHGARTSLEGVAKQTVLLFIRDNLHLVKRGL